jgi:hypothetical protein
LNRAGLLIRPAWGKLEAACKRRGFALADKRRASLRPGQFDAGLDPSERFRDAGKSHAPRFYRQIDIDRHLRQTANEEI